MSQSREPFSSFGLSFGWSYLLAAFTLTITGCLPLAWLMTMYVSTGDGARGTALLTWLPIMALAIAAACAVFYATKLRHHPQWRPHALIAMWALSAVGMWGWWTL